MTTLDELMREFRASLPDPDDGAQERILERARRAHGEAHEGTVAPRRRRRFAWPGPPPLGGPANGSRCPGDPRHRARARPRPGGPRRPGRPRAGRARGGRGLAPHEILALSIRIRRSTTDPRATARDETTHVEQWTPAGAGRAMAWRSLITDGPLDEWPTDEGSTVLTDRAERVIDQRSWTPLGTPGSRRGELWIGGPVGQPGPDSLAEHLRDAYARRLLRPAGRTADGSLRLRGGPVLGGSPREVSITGSPASCGTSRAPTDQEVWLITRAASLPATAANRRLLAVADWPTLRAVRWAGVGRPGTPVHHVPPVPALDEG